MNPKLRAALHDVWDEHVALTRMFIVSFAAGLPDAPVILARLLKNQESIGDLLSPYVGLHGRGALVGLLKQHITQAGDVLKAAKAGDQVALGAAQLAWQANAVKLADLLAPKLNVPKVTVADMLLDHLAQTTVEASARLAGDWAKDIAAYDTARRHMLNFADFIADRLGA